MIDRYEKKKNDLIVYVGESEVHVGVDAFEQFRLGTVDPEDYWDLAGPEEIMSDIEEFLILIHGEFYFERLIAERDSMISDYE